jgi:hypothetical protein
MKKLPIDKAKGHEQIEGNSCVPMSVELVLKLEGEMQPDDFSLQNDKTKIGNSEWIKNPRFEYPSRNPKIRFDREFMNKDVGKQDHTDEALAENLEPTLETIDNELEAGRYPIISVKSGPSTTHNIVIYGKVDDSNYNTITFHHNHGVLDQVENIRQKIIERKGTDILTYKYIDGNEGAKQ